MSLTTDRTTLVCLFHHDDQAKAALEDLNEAGVPKSAISTLRGRANSNDVETSTTSNAELTALGIPSRDVEHLQDGLDDGGTIISVHAEANHIEIVEKIFGDHRATKIDEVDSDPEYATASAPVAAMSAEGVAIPIVEEELLVGKRTVDQGGVRVYKRIVEIPAEQSINLREEHVIVERNLVNRPATAADLAQGARSIELTETAEEAVVSKTAHVVEEVLIGKQVGEHTEHIHDTVRHTEVELEELPPAANTTTSTRNL